MCSQYLRHGDSRLSSSLRRSCPYQRVRAASSSESPTSVGLACRPVGAWRRHLVKHLQVMRGHRWRVLCHCPRDRKASESAGLRPKRASCVGGIVRRLRECRPASRPSCCYTVSLCLESVWRGVVPLLADHHQVHAPNALGHRGGPSVQRRPVTMDDVVDAAEYYLDERGLDRPHLAGNSLGAFMAIELARRGRAATVCALAPPGLWSPGDGLQARAMDPRGRGLSRLMRPVLPLMFRSASVRRLRDARLGRPRGSTDPGPSGGDH